MANIYGTYTLFRRETRRFLKVYKQTIFAPVISSILFMAIFGISVKRAVPGLEDLSYLQFLVPGLILMGIINNAYQNSSSSIVQMKFFGLIENLMTIPLSRKEIMLAFTLSSTLRGLIVGGVTYLTALLFVGFPYPSIPIILAASILVSLFFSFLGIIVGLWSNSFDRLSAVQSFLLQPLIFLGGVFYSITSLPGAFSSISRANPIVYMINLLRYGFTGYHEFPIPFSLAFTAGITLALGAITYYLLKKGYSIQD